MRLWHILFFFIISLLIPLSSYAKFPTILKSDFDPSILKIKEEVYLGKSVPDIKMFDENGNSLTLSNFKGKPLILSIIYYTCPHICMPLSEALAEASVKINDLRLGSDYNILTLSFSKYDTPQRARDFRKNLERKVRMPQDAEKWVFATASEDEVKRITEATGYRFFYIEEDNVFVHPAVYIFLSPEGKITRYIFGITTDPFDIKMAILESAKGRIGKTPIANIMALACYKYDSENRGYIVNLPMLFALVGVVMAIMTGMLSFIVYRKKKTLRGG